jgi:hypothetical protein
MIIPQVQLNWKCWHPWDVGDYAKNTPDNVEVTVHDLGEGATDQTAKCRGKVRGEIRSKRSYIMHISYSD